MRSIKPLNLSNHKSMTEASHSSRHHTTRKFPFQALKVITILEAKAKTAAAAAKEFSTIRKLIKPNIRSRARFS